MKFYIGIDIGGTNTKVGIIDENGLIHASDHFKTHSKNGFSKTIENIASKTKDLVVSHKFNINDLISVGVGVPGPVLNKKIVTFFANFPWDKNLNLSDEFRKYFNVPVYVDNDVNIITMGETWQGAAKGYKNVLGVAIGTGIGAGIVVDGKILSGKNGAAAEIGHIKLQTKNGRLCGCGQKGCFEAYASATGLLRETLSRLQVNKNNKLYKLYEEKNGDIEAKDIFETAKMGDMFSQDIVDYEAGHLAHGLSIALNLLDPEIVVLGGGISLAGDYLLDKVKMKLHEYTLATIMENLVIANSVLGDNAGIYGAVYLAITENKGE